MCKHSSHSNKISSIARSQLNEIAFHIRNFPCAASTIDQLDAQREHKQTMASFLSKRYFIAHIDGIKMFFRLMRGICVALFMPFFSYILQRRKRSCVTEKSPTVADISRKHYSCVVPMLRDGRASHMAYAFSDKICGWCSVVMQTLNEQAQTKCSSRADQIVFHCSAPLSIAPTRKKKYSSRDTASVFSWVNVLSKSGSTFTFSVYCILCARLCVFVYECWRAYLFRSELNFSAIFVTILSQRLFTIDLYKDNNDHSATIMHQFWTKYTNLGLKVIRIKKKQTIDVVFIFVHFFAIVFSPQHPFANIEFGAHFGKHFFVVNYKTSAEWMSCFFCCCLFNIPKRVEINFCALVNEHKKMRKNHRLDARCRWHKGK